MRGRKSEQLAESARIESLTNDSLIDVSDAARASGINVPVALSRGMWTSLVRPFPSAQTGDYLALASSLSDLATITESMLRLAARLPHRKGASEWRAV